jgi:hypothetical protein
MWHGSFWIAIKRRIKVLVTRAQWGRGSVGAAMCLLSIYCKRKATVAKVMSSLGVHTTAMVLSLRLGLCNGTARQMSHP